MEKIKRLKKAKEIKDLEGKTAPGNQQAFLTLSQSWKRRRAMAKKKRPRRKSACSKSGN
jgi:hypothetical protein